MYPKTEFGQWYVRRHRPDPNALFGKSDLAYQTIHGSTWIKNYWDQKWMLQAELYVASRIYYNPAYNFDILLDEHEPMIFDPIYARPEDIEWYRNNYITRMNELLESFKR